MRGHTSNRLLRACLRSIISRSKHEIERRKDYPAEADYFQGRIDAAQEIAILLAIDIEDKTV